MTSFALERRLDIASAAALGSDVQTVTCHIKAMNSRARLMCAAAPQPDVQNIPEASAEGDEWAEHDQMQDTYLQTDIEQIMGGSALDPARRAGQASLLAESLEAAAFAYSTVRQPTHRTPVTGTRQPVRKAQQAGLSTPPAQQSQNPAKRQQGGGAPHR